MPLPKIETPKYELKLPSTGQKIKYRPYLVGEEKVLMIAMESENQTQIFEAVKDTIVTCTNGAIPDPDKLPVFDLEYVFLKLRAKSTGEISNVALKCEKCEKSTKVAINLDEIAVDTSALPSTNIKLTDKIGVVMHWPRASLVSELAAENASAADRAKLAFKMVINCIETVYDDKGTYPAADQTQEEMEQFIESLNQQQFAKIQKFIESTPKLEHTVDFTCEGCKAAQKMTIRGLQNFFV